MLMWEAMELSSCPRVIIDSTGKGEITMKKALILALAACLTLTCSACAFTPEAALVETPQFSDNHAAELDEPPLPEEITDGASDIYTSWLDSGRGYLLKKGFPAAGQMPCTLYRTEDGESWTRVRSLSGWELTDREREIIKSFFGIGCQEMTLEEIGERFGLTRERVRQIKEKAIRRLKSPSRSKLLNSYLG